MISLFRLNPTPFLNKNIDKREERFGLTRLAVAAMAGDVRTAKRLIQEGAHPGTQDVHGWTPLHYAELQQDRSMIEMLQAVSKARDLGLETIKNKAGLAPNELFARTQVSAAASDETVFFYRNKAGKVVPGTAKTFHKMTGAIFTHRVLASPQALADEWAESALLLENSGGQEEKRKQYHQFQHHPPKIYLGKSNGYGVFAGQRIAENVIITTFGGRKREEGEDVYRLANVDGLRERNLGPMINDSMPNAIFGGIFYVDGLCFLPVVMSVKKIEKGEEIIVDYGQDHLVKTNHTELRPKALESFVRENPLEQLAEVRSNEKPIRTTVRHYLAGTPDAILHLLLKEIVTIEQVSNFLKEARDLPHYTKSYFKVFEHFFQGREHLSEEMRSGLLQLNQKEPIKVLVSLLEYLLERKNVCAWEKLEQAVQSFLQLAQDDGEVASTQFLKAILALPEDAQGEIFLNLLKLAHQDARLRALSMEKPAQLSMRILEACP